MDLSYFNARLRGMRARLLRRADYETFAALSGVEQYADRLKGTAYGPYIETASARKGGAKDVIATAVRASLAAAFADMRRNAPPQADVYLSALLSLWEVYDLKVILRAIARSINAEEALDTLVGAGELDSAAIKTLLNNAKDVPDLISFLETWGSRYARPLKDGLYAYTKSGSTALMEHNLDVMGFDSIRRSLNPRSKDAAIILSLISARIDGLNIMTLFKLSGEHSVQEGASFFIEGGVRLGKGDFIELLGSRDRDELIDALDGVLIERQWKDVVANAGDGDMALLEERLSATEDAALRRLSVTEPLSIALAASYMQMKAREVKNLRLLARGLAFAVPDEVLKRYLIYPM